MFMFRILYNYVIETYKIANNKDHQYEVKRALLILFLDDPNCLLSLHSICRRGEEKKTGEIGKFWKQNMTLKCLSSIFTENPVM